MFSIAYDPNLHDLKIDMTDRVLMMKYIYTGWSLEKREI